MSQNNSRQFTYQTRIDVDEPKDILLLKCADLLSRVERNLFADISKGKAVSDLKSDYLKRFGITARHFNSFRIAVEGKIASIKERRSGEIKEKKRQIKSIEKTIDRLSKSDTKNDMKTLHFKKRRLHSLQNDLQKLINDDVNDRVRLCFGSRKVFHQQFFLEENGFSSFDEWKSVWRKKRSSSFFIVGSKDETSGNQTCKAVVQPDQSITLFLRLPDALGQKYLVIENVRFAYGHDVILRNIKLSEERRTLQKQKNPVYKHVGEAINYRFKRDDKGWLIFATTHATRPEYVSKRGYGAIGIDINADHVAVVETDRFQNPVHHETIPLVTYGKTKHQSKACIENVVCQIVERAHHTKKPIVIEKLDFQNKKMELREFGSPRYARMLSSFSYQKFREAIYSRAYRCGIHVIEVNPAYTSVIGAVKFSCKYGLSIHEAAALVIARRNVRASERLPTNDVFVMNRNGIRVAFSLPERNRDQHVWTQWRKVKKRLLAVRVAQPQAKRSSSRHRSACCDGKDPPGVRR